MATYIRRLLTMHGWRLQHYRRLLLPLLALGLLPVLGCPQPAKTARDIIAASNAVLTTAQAQHEASCKANPSQTVCQTINRTGAAQNVALDALGVYCGYTSSTIPGQVCTPVARALPALQSALANLQQVVADLKGVM